MKVSLKWITPNADMMVAHMARVSNPNAKPDDPSDKLIRYLIDHHHWSPFEMACMCVEIETTRDIGRQILRHRSFHFQEFSQRYSEVEYENLEFRECRLQDPKNRQNSFVTTDTMLVDAWGFLQSQTADIAIHNYHAAINRGVAKEVARALLPEGLTPTRMYMQGTLRDWIHYLSIRTRLETQFEHQQVARQIEFQLLSVCPVIMDAVYNANLMTPFQTNR